jgi:hypothetical protein
MRDEGNSAREGGLERPWTVRALRVRLTRFKASLSAIQAVRGPVVKHRSGGAYVAAIDVDMIIHDKPSDDLAIVLRSQSNLVRVKGEVVVLNDGGQSIAR